MLAEGTALEVTLPGEQVGHACGAQRSQPPARGGFGVGQAQACGSRCAALEGGACTSMRVRAPPALADTRALTVGRVPPTYRYVRQVLRDAGWTKLRQRGSHEVWTSPDGRSRVTVAGKDSDTVKPGSLAAIRRQTGFGGLR